MFLDVLAVTLDKVAVMRHFISFLIFISFSSGYTQGESNNWYFGIFAGITFNSGAPVGLDDGALRTGEGCGSISDASGNLLFYTNGEIIYSRNHLPMPNGAALSGSRSSSQTGIIVPHPGNPYLFYVFSVNAFDALVGTVHYSIVDLRLNRGLGDVTLSKNVLLQISSSERITTTKHADGNSIWVITQRSDTNEYLSYLIDQNGINVNPVVSTVGGSGPRQLGSMKVSPDGTKLACAFGLSNALEILEFNAATGQLFNPIIIQANSNTGNLDLYGLEFSSNSNYVFVSFRNGGITQYNISNYTQTAIASTEVSLNYVPPPSGVYDRPATLQRGPDDKIYVAISSHTGLGVIHNPNLAGQAANYQFIGVPLSGRSTSGLPQLVPDIFSTLITVENNCVGDLTGFQVDSNKEIVSATWDFGDGNTSTLLSPDHSYAGPGDYNVSVVVSSATDVVTATAVITIHESPIATMPDDLQVCEDVSNNGFASITLSDQDDAILNGQSLNDFTISYYESEAESQSGINPLPNVYTTTSNPQIIYARVENRSNPECYDITMFQVEVLDRPDLTMATKYSICEGEPIEIIADSVYDSYLWSTGETTPSIVVSAVMSLTLTVSRDYGDVICNQMLSIDVVDPDDPIINNIIIHEWSINDNSIEVDMLTTGDYEYSIDGLNYQSSNRFENLPIGEYQIRVRDIDGCVELIREVFLLFHPRFFTPNGDGFNDFWQITNAQSEPQSEIYILDRFGKLLKQISPTGIGWDGTYNGEPLPSNDYWFIFKRQDGTEYRGHFTLKR